MDTKLSSIFYRYKLKQQLLISLYFLVTPFSRIHINWRSILKNMDSEEKSDIILLAEIALKIKRKNKRTNTWPVISLKVLPLKCILRKLPFIQKMLFDEKLRIATWPAVLVKKIFHLYISLGNFQILRNNLKKNNPGQTLLQVEGVGRRCSIKKVFLKIS